jgi:hypothetical protein
MSEPKPGMRRDEGPIHTDEFEARLDENGQVILECVVDMGGWYATKPATRRDVLDSIEDHYALLDWMDRMANRYPQNP